MLQSLNRTPAIPNLKLYNSYAVPGSSFRGINSNYTCNSPNSHCPDGNLFTRVYKFHYSLPSGKFFIVRAQVDAQRTQRSGTDEYQLFQDRNMILRDRVTNSKSSSRFSGFFSTPTSRLLAQPLSVPVTSVSVGRHSLRRCEDERRDNKSNLANIHSLPPSIQYITYISSEYLGLSIVHLIVYGVLKFSAGYCTLLSNATFEADGHASWC